MVQRHTPLNTLFGRRPRLGRSPLAITQGTGKGQHSASIAKVNVQTLKTNVKREAVGEKPLPLPLLPFEPYILRHTALTRMSPYCDPFTLARIAGHSSITITQRYCHPQADAVEAAFSKFGSRERLTEPQMTPSLPRKEEI